MFVTAGTQQHGELLAELCEALEELGLEARIDDDSIRADDGRISPLLLTRAHPTPAELGDLMGDYRGQRPVVVVADRISDAGRDRLRQHGWGWLDRRGHLRVWTPGLRIDAPLPSTRSERESTGNIWTTVGLETALHTLVEPTEPVTARRVAPVIGRSVGTTHELIGRFRAVGLIGSRTGLPLLPELFWETAAHWPDGDWVPIAASLAEVTGKVSPDDLVRVDERAATLGGARIAAAGDLPARCYVRSPSALRRLRSLVDRSAPTRCWVRKPPIQWIPLNDDFPPDDEHPWSIAHPVLCAVRLAADPARGQEIVEAWGIVPGADRT